MISRVTAMCILILTGCDVTDVSDGGNPAQLESKVLAFEFVKRPIAEQANVNLSQSAVSIDTPDVQPESSAAEIPETTTGTPESVTPTISTAAALSNRVIGDAIATSFWVCSNDQATRSFRYQFSRPTLNSFQVYPVTVIVREDTDGANGERLGNSWWRIDTDDAIEIAPTRTEFDPANYRWSSIRFNNEFTRVRLSDSRGFELSCARIQHNTGCSFDDYAGCSLPPEDAGDDPIRVTWEIASTDLLINGDTPDLASNYWACERGGGNDSFRMKVGRSRGIRVLEGITGTANSTGYGLRTDTVGAIHFTSTFSGTTTSIWQLHDLSFAENAQTFTALDTRGFDLSCSRKPESSRWSPGLAVYSCFYEPRRCDVQ